MFSLIRNLFFLKNNYKIQSFTFFIPSPPARSSGYREKQFDKLFYDFINKGYKILNISTETSTGEKHSGMWIILIVQALNKQAEALNLEDIFLDSINNKASEKNSIDGLYYIDDQAE